MAGHLASHDEEPLVESDLGADIDEPPDSLVSKVDFERRGITRPAADLNESLLTKALRDEVSFVTLTLDAARKRPSMASNASIASTADLTCDTGNTSPARAPSPSPPLPAVTYLLNRPDSNNEKAAPTPVRARPRRISFACAEPPRITKPSSPAPSKVLEPTRRSTIKFACPVPSKHNSASQAETIGPFPSPPVRQTSIKFACSEKPQQISVKNQTIASTPASVNSCENNATPVAGHKFLTATPDLKLEGSRFHEFASDEHQLDDWIIQDSSIPKSRLTMSDILAKEVSIRKLAKEAMEEEDEEDEEEEEEDGLVDEEELAEIDSDEGENDSEEECDEDEEDDPDAGYLSDSEHGFGDSDDDELGLEDDEVEVDVPVWLPKQIASQGSPSLEFSYPAASFESHSSVFSVTNGEIIPTQRMKIGRGKPNLPDSTDFVCGTFDEDRVVEDIYMTVVAARKRSKLHAIPQDIDPSFPASEPEDEDDNYRVSDTAPQESDEFDLGFGELEGLNGAERTERRHRRSDASLRLRCRSPPPKKQISPPIKMRARSPRPLFGRTPSRRFHSPPLALQYPKSPRASPVHKNGVATCKPLATQPGLTFTKSLPRPVALFPTHLKARRKNGGKGGHRRGAIDIVKGLEQKRQRRREKYLQKYCDRARKGQIPDKKPVLPGEGVERMRELGLLMAGKRGPGYVLSF